MRWTIARPGNETVRSVNALVGETNDGSLNDTRFDTAGNGETILALPVDRLKELFAKYGR